MDIIFAATVSKVEEKTRIVRGYKDSDQKACTETASMGWFIHLADQNASFGVGMEKPDFENGD